MGGGLKYGWSVKFGEGAARRENLCRERAMTDPSESQMLVLGYCTYVTNIFSPFRSRLASVSFLIFLAHVVSFYIMCDRVEGSICS